MVADALMNEMGKCVRDMFTNAHKDMKQLPEGKNLSEFRFEHICKFWLIAPLVRLCPQPANVPQQFHSTRQTFIDNLIP
ncbi:hypothetical protein WR25_13411 [Diploscapter pachys]|uniref:Uncharacterized protein n=1 Tax=Diploscapter pachys TaxID=2018661 RepID=A0A2A2KMN4_9BILA|nr:hypothetical protein WR25_13411 [Diploscapter pachys]